jgi:hypothetical protein
MGYGRTVGVRGRIDSVSPRCSINVGEEIALHVRYRAGQQAAHAWASLGLENATAGHE